MRLGTVSGKGGDRWPGVWQVQGWMTTRTTMMMMGRRKLALSVALATGLRPARFPCSGRGCRHSDGP